MNEIKEAIEHVKFCIKAGVDISLDSNDMPLILSALRTIEWINSIPTKWCLGDYGKCYEGIKEKFNEYQKES